MARARSEDDGYDDYSEDENEYRPRRRRSRRDPDFEDDDDAPPAAGPLDKFFGQTSMGLLVLFACCCGALPLILGIIAYVTGRDEKAKSNAMVIIVLSGFSMVFWFVVQVAIEIAKAD